MINVFQSFAYNTQLAKTYGIKSSIYMSYVGFEKSFDRTGMYNITGLNTDEQRSVEDFLLSNGLIITVTESNGYVSVVIDRDKIRVLSDCANVVTDEHSTINRKTRIGNITKEQVVNAISECDSKKRVCEALGISTPSLEKLLLKYDIVIPAKKRKTKQDKMYDSMIRSVDTGDEVVNQYVIDWINSVRDNPKRYMTKQSFELSLNKMLSFYANQEDRIEVLKIAIKGSYSDIDWAIDKYEGRKPINNNFTNYSEIKSDGSEMVGETF